MSWHITNNKAKNLVLFSFGALSSLAFAPFFYIGCLVISFVVLLHFLIEADNSKQAFWQGWWFGLGHFIVGLYWIGYALLIESEKFALLMPLAILGIPLICATIYIGPAAFVAKRFGINALSLSVSWQLFEIARGYFFSGFPWNLIAYSVADNLVLSQIVAIFGSYGLSFIIIFCATSIYYLIKPTYRILNLCVILVILIFSFTYGINRLDDNPTIYSNSHLTIIQANIDQKDILNRDLIAANIQKHIELSKQAKQYIIWPESAITIPIDSPGLLDYLKLIIPKGGSLITGATRNEHDLWYNSLVTVNDIGFITNYYDKIHLVPFGEYIPMRKLLPKYFEKITGGLGDWDKGINSRILQIDSELPRFRPLICYEAIFGYEIGASGFSWLLTITNDAWFGNSPGPYQHFHMARFRAIEQAAPLVRAANRGISAIIDSYGRIIKSLDLNQTGVINSYLPHAGKITWFARYPYLTHMILIILFIFNASYYAFKDRFKII